MTDLTRAQNTLAACRMARSTIRGDDDGALVAAYESSPCAETLDRMMALDRAVFAAEADVQRAEDGDATARHQALADAQGITLGQFYVNSAAQYAAQKAAEATPTALDAALAAVARGMGHVGAEVIRTKAGTAGVHAAIIRSACTCDIATPVKCVCMFISACTIHGGKHHGTHD